MTLNKYFITLQHNGVQYGQFTKKQHEFLTKCLYINEVEHREFCCIDFREMSNDSFRQYIHILKNYIDITMNSYPKFYKIKGVKGIYNNYKRLTGTVIGTKMLQLLNKLPEHQIILNELKINVKINPKFFNILSYFGLDDVNFKEEIVLENMQFDSEIITSVKITSKLIEISLHADKQPIVYDMLGILKITKILGVLEGELRGRTRDIIPIVSVDDWECISYQLGMNGQYSYDKPKHCMVWKDFAGGFLRKYSEMGGKSDIDSLIDTR